MTQYPFFSEPPVSSNFSLAKRDPDPDFSLAIPHAENSVAGRVPAFDDRRGHFSSYVELLEQD